MQFKELKNELINNGTYAQFSFRKFELSLYSKNRVEPINYNNYADFLNRNEFKACLQISQCKSKKRCKLKSMLDFYFLLSKKTNGNFRLFFATFTFNDDALELSPNYRRRILIEALSKQFTDFYFNVDFSPIKNREHYHGIIIASKKQCGNMHFFLNSQKQIYCDKIDNFNYNLGFYNLQEINSFNQSQTIFYTTKLTSHAYKKETGSRSIFTKKNSPYKLDLKLKKMDKK